MATKWGLPLYGQWLLLVTIPTFLAAGDLGFGSAAGYRLIGEVAQGNTDEARITFQSALAVVLGCSATVLISTPVVIALLPDRLLAVSGGLKAEETREVLLVLIVWAVVAIQSNLFIAVMRAHGAFAFSASFEATIQLVEGLAVIVIVVSGGTPLHAAFGYLAVRTLGVAGHVMLARRSANWLVLGFEDSRKSRMSELLRPALAAMMLPFAQAGYLQGTALAVGAAAGAAAVPILVSLRTLSRVALQLIYTVNVPVLPEFTAEHARGNVAWLNKVVGALTTLNALIGVLAGFVLALAGNAILAWWTRGTIVAPQAMIYQTATALLAGAVWNPLSYFLLAVNRHEKFAYVFGIAACTAVISSYALVRHWGVTGAAAANLALDLSMLGFVIVQIRHVTGPFPVGLSAMRFLFAQRQRPSGN